MVEWWKNGCEKKAMPEFCLYKDRSHSAKPNIPTFHYSTIPYHSIAALANRDLRASLESGCFNVGISSSFFPICKETPKKTIDAVPALLPNEAVI
jgi:hypothetical protein